MKTSTKGVAAIAGHEGVVTKAYKDVAGIWTIGVGHTAFAGPPKPVPGMRITRQEAFDILARDLSRFEARVNRELPNVPQHVFDGAVSFDFNTGGIHRASWVGKYQAGDMAGAEASLKLWNKAGGRVVRGLINRRKAEADLIFRGRYPGGPAVERPDRDTVKAYQQQLAALGYYPTSLIDGIRGPKTVAAVKEFQTDADLVVDGIVGPATRAALDIALKMPPQPIPDDPGPVPKPDPEIGPAPVPKPGTDKAGVIVLVGVILAAVAIGLKAFGVI